MIHQEIDEFGFEISVLHSITSQFQIKKGKTLIFNGIVENQNVIIQSKSSIYLKNLERISSLAKFQEKNPDMKAVEVYRRGYMKNLVISKDFK